MIYCDILHQVARLLMADDKFRPDYSIIFVAFDREEEGCEGSRAFVRSFLIPEIVVKFGAAVQVDN